MTRRPCLTEWNPDGSSARLISGVGQSAASVYPRGAIGFLPVLLYAPKAFRGGRVRVYGCSPGCLPCRSPCRCFSRSCSTAASICSTKPPAVARQRRTGAVPGSKRQAPSSRRNNERCGWCSLRATVLNDEQWRLVCVDHPEHPSTPPLLSADPGLGDVPGDALHLPHHVVAFMSGDDPPPRSRVRGRERPGTELGRHGDPRTRLGFLTRVSARARRVPALDYPTTRRGVS